MKLDLCCYGLWCGCFQIYNLAEDLGESGLLHLALWFINPIFLSQFPILFVVKSGIGIISFELIHLPVLFSPLFNYWTCIVREWDEKKPLESLVDKCVSSSSVTGDIFHIEVFTSGLASFSFTVLPSFQLIQTNICKRNSNSLEEKYFSRVAAKSMERHRYFTLSIFSPKMLRRRFRYST